MNHLKKKALAAYQKAYEARKNKTHTRVHVWVPKEHLKDFKTAVSTLKEKWKRASGKRALARFSNE